MQNSPSNTARAAPRPSRNGAATSQKHTDSPARDFAVVAVGASAGGLEACRRLVRALPEPSGMAFLLIQHLDPDHASMLPALLANHTSMTVREAATGMSIEPDNLYVIPPGTYLSVADGALLVTPPQVMHAVRLPFDILLHALAEQFQGRARCVILSGTGNDGSQGARAIKQHGGLVIAQDPAEAEHASMPRNAIGTGAVDLVLPIEAIPEALARYDRRLAEGLARDVPDADEAGRGDGLPEIIELLRTRTVHDFTLYKPGTLQRRVERRMAMAAIEIDGMQRYLDMLKGDNAELELLAKDLLINVTNFFRDLKVFRLLEQKIIPDLIQSHAGNHTIRIWIAGCSTGEETYSLAMLFQEQIAAARSDLKLQLFASDVDADAVASARTGVYPKSIEADVSPARLAQFFSREEHGYKIQPDLRAAVIFTIQDVLADPPFSRLDMISCRNLLIYLQAEAQARIISLFHFALRPGGVLLLGSAETVGNAAGRFEPIYKTERLYRHIGRGRPSDIGLATRVGDGLRLRQATPQGQPNGPTTARQSSLAELGRRLILDSFAPAAVLINRRYECLYVLGPTDRYLKVPPGHQTNDLLAMARLGIRSKLRLAIHRAYEEQTRIVISGGRVSHEDQKLAFDIDVQPVPNAGEDLLLVCFVDRRQPQDGKTPPTPGRPPPRMLELEQELEAARVELRAALRDLDASQEEQKVINEEALSVNEEHQSTNEELLTSKEELQSLNEELTALNGQLQETLERQRVTSDDLQNVLYSTDVATLFLDLEFRIRFFTPASRALFNIIPSDVGRPLADLHSLAADGELLADAHAVLQTLAPVDREIEKSGAIWFTRRILPYRAHDTRVEGVVITFTDITERKTAARALEVAKQQSELANVAKSRFLAAASHDLRQPLQTLTLLQGLLAKAVEGEKAARLVDRFNDTLGAMSGMLNTLLDINQIEAGVVQAKVIGFPINDLLARLKEEFTYHAQAQGIELRVVMCGLRIDSDPRLLEQMLRNLLSNALKYTKRGRVLLGCRRQAGALSVQVWDTGVGIPDTELKAIFEEYHQLDNAARERSRGLGLGLSIVQRLATMLRHTVHVRSRAGRGSMFAIDIAVPVAAGVTNVSISPPATNDAAALPARRTGVLLVVEDDPEVRELLQIFLQDEGHLAATTRDGNSALDLVTRGILRPELILADYNLPNGLNGLQLALRLRASLGAAVPVVILTGDISTETMRSVAEQGFVQLNKPVKLAELTQVITRLLPAARARTAAIPPAAPPAADPGPPQATVYIVDDDIDICESTRVVLQAENYQVETFLSGESFLRDYRAGPRQILLIDAYLPGMTGLDLLRTLREAGHTLPAIVITGLSDVPMVVKAMKSGAADFIEKPIGRVDLLASLSRALEQAQDSTQATAWQESAVRHLGGLTLRQRQIMAMVLAGHPSKNIAADLKISQRTVENHRASIMHKTGAASLPALARLALAASFEVKLDEPARAKRLPVR